MPDKHGRPVLTDLVLQSYADQVRSIAACCDRIFDIGTQGLKTGIPYLEEDANLFKLLPCSSGAKEAWRESVESLQRAPYGSALGQQRHLPGQAGDRFVEFVLQEKKKLESGILCFERELAHADDVAAGQLQSSLRELDYTHFFFPEISDRQDASPSDAQSLDRVFHARVLASARYFLKLWGRVGVG